MELKSIQNSGVVNLTNCDQEPIHIPGTIQPHGFLLALNTAYEVVLCSANAAIFGLTPETILNKNIKQVVDTREADILVTYLNNRVFESARPHVFTHADVLFNTTVHTSGGYFILEFEPFPDGSLELASLYLQTQKFTEILSKAVGLKQLCQTISEEIKSITGYDRVMIYKFDEQYNGEVFAEAVNDNLEPFLGLHYPHTDIPVQARELYLRNLMRMIVDVNYTPVPVLTLDSSLSSSHLDMSHSVLRSVSPIHIEYLKNMGVSGTLTISLIRDGKLWGLVACHHYAPKNIPHYIRLSALLQGHFLTSQIRVQEVNSDYDLKLDLDEKLRRFLALLDKQSTKEENNIVCKELLLLTNANGVCIVSDNDIQAYGDVPPADELLKFIALPELKQKDFAVSDNIAHDLSFQFSNHIAGIMYYNTDGNNYIIWFKNELEQEIAWAGDPEKAIVKDNNGLSPRKSFGLWKQMVTGQSSDWLSAEVNIANQAVYAIQKHFSFIKDKRIQKTQDALVKRLNQANEELENINWISTHDLKEPLRKIRVFASLLLDDDKFEFNEAAVNMVNKMHLSAERMQGLLDDLLSLSRIKDGAYPFELFDLNAMMTKIIADQQDALGNKDIAFFIEGLPQIQCIPVLISQLFANLVSNAIKFCRQGEPLTVKASSEEVIIKGQVFYKIVFSDNGIGFENKYSDLIFQVFQRLDKSSGIDGSGIGLAICKKIVSIHKGTIAASSEPGNGAIFTILLPFDPANVDE